LSHEHASLGEHLLCRGDGTRCRDLARWRLLASREEQRRDQEQ
jgi:hypothetical protein